MKYFFVLLAVAAVVILVGACRSTKKTALDTDQKPTFVMTKGKCFGKCKAYSLSGFENHRLAFVGVKNVEHIGVHTSNISAKVYDELIAQLTEANLGSLDDEYLSPAKDLAEIELSFKGKTIRFHKRRAPEALRELVTMLDEVAFAQAWEAVE